MAGASRKINKNLYYYPCYNFGDELNKYLFEAVFGVQFNYTTNVLAADYIAIGSVIHHCGIQHCGLKPRVEKRRLVYMYQLLKKKVKGLLKKKVERSELTVLGAGLMNWSDEYKIQFARKMDYKIVRGKLTENYLRKNNLLKTNVLLGDLGLLASYMCNSNEKKYTLGIIPHFSDLHSPVIYDVYKKQGKSAIIINVQDEVGKVLKQISECETILSSSLHGLIVADSFNIPNVWFENTLKRIQLESRELDRFKYKDYYSVYGIDEIAPVNILDIMEINTDTIVKSYKIKKEMVVEKQKELYTYCKNYFETI